MSTMILSDNTNLSPRSLPGSILVPDIPNGKLQSTGDSLTKKVAAVSATWKWATLDERTLAILIPHGQDPRGVSKDAFVSLLEYCEDLCLDKVVAVFERKDVDLTSGFPKTLRYIGFRVLAPDCIPTPVDASAHFAMVYQI